MPRQKPIYDVPPTKKQKAQFSSGSSSEDNGENNDGDSSDIELTQATSEKTTFKVRAVGKICH